MKPKSLGVTLKILRESKGLTIQELSNQSSVGSGTIGDIETGRNKSTVKTITKLANALKLGEVDKSKLFAAFLNNPAENTINIVAENKVVSIPVYGRASAGNGYLNMEERLYSKSIHLNGFSKDSFLVEVSGDSMTPLIEDGSFALIDPSQNEISSGKIYVVTYQDETYIKIIEINEKLGVVILRSSNSEYANIVISETEFQSVKINGRVVKIISEKYL